MNEALCESIALAHDLGHTPFGHVGGDTLDSCLKKDGFTNGFEHNFQSFRVVSFLEKRYKAFDGLNLTFATLEGILKHSYPYKKNFLPSKIHEQFNLDTHPSIEAMIVDRADEIAYTSHDIDDGINSGLISFDDLKESELVREILAKVEAEGIKESDDAMFRYRFSSHLINHLVYSLLDYSREKIHSREIQSAILDSTTPIPIGMKKDLEAKLKTRKKHRVITDYIALMSDRYAISFYKEMYGRL